MNEVHVIIRGNISEGQGEIRGYACAQGAYHEVHIMDIRCKCPKIIDMSIRWRTVVRFTL
jgi:hypothetical protein